jgi:hypothetical protein
LHIQAFVEVDESPDITQAIIDYGDHLLIDFSTPRALRIFAPITKTETMFL